MDEQQEQPLMVDILPAQDRTTILVMFRSTETIAPKMLAEAMKTYAEMLLEKTSKIVKPPGIISC